MTTGTIVLILQSVVAMSTLVVNTKLKESEEKTQEKSEAPTDTLGRFKKFHIQ